jgi:hypothetical protein
LGAAAVAWRGSPLEGALSSRRGLLETLRKGLL